MAIQTVELKTKRSFGNLLDFDPLGETEGAARIRVLESLDDIVL